ncbi:MAG: hypothetical protein PF481_03790 [Bacteroidales bacterium]|jgi:hypothetical protein|nr:hypothetical protein [Bacteroidales bacterium]
MNIPKAKKQQFIIFAFCILYASIYIVLFDFLRFNETDTPNFINAAKILFGAEGIIDNQSRITKPFVLLLPGLLHTYLEIPITGTMLVQNILFFIGTGIYTSKLLQLWNYSFSYQLLGAFILYTIQPIAVFSFILINDIAGYFFTTIALYYYFYSFSKSLGIIQYITLAGICLAGILSKESSALAMVIIALHTILYNKKNIIHITYMFAGIIGIYTAIQFFISHTFGYVSSIQNLAQKHTGQEDYVFKVEQLIHSFDIYWLYILGGIIYIFTNKQKYIFYAWASLCALPFLFLWPSVQDRTIAVATPIFIWVIILFLQKSNTHQKLLLLCGGIGNITCSYLIYKHQAQSLLPVFYSIFLLLFLLLYRQKLQNIGLIDKC